MKKEGYEYLFNEAIRYLGKYPATKKKLKNILRKNLEIKILIKKQPFQKILKKTL